MRFFLSYASEDKVLAEEVQLALCAPGHEVFFDKQSLAAAGDYNSSIRDAVQQSDCFIFLITPDSVRTGRYTLTEMKYAEERWPSPKGRVLPVMAKVTPWADVPAYLRAVTVLEPKGNLAAETLDAASKMSAALSPAVGMLAEAPRALHVGWRLGLGAKRAAVGALVGAAMFWLLGALLETLHEALDLHVVVGDAGPYTAMFALMGGVVGGNVGFRGPKSRPFLRLLGLAASLTRSWVGSWPS